MSIFTDSEKAQVPALAAREQSIDYFTKPFTFTRMSRLHEKAAPWTPERGSRAWRELSRKRSTIAKYHWRDSDCTRIGYDKDVWSARDRVLDGYSFNILASHEKCPYCSNQFNNA